MYIQIYTFTTIIHRRSTHSFYSMMWRKRKETRMHMHTYIWSKKKGVRATYLFPFLKKSVRADTYTHTVFSWQERIPRQRGGGQCMTSKKDKRRARGEGRRQKKQTVHKSI